MARPTKAIVDYFPHMAEDSDSLKIIVLRFKNDGYVLWFRLLSLLAQSENHYFNINNHAKFELFCAKCHLNQEKAIEILDSCAELEMIDNDLWEKEKIIYCQNFIEGIREAYRNRKIKLLEKSDLFPQFCKKNQNSGISDVINSVSDVRNPQIREEEIREEEIKEEEISSVKNSLSGVTKNIQKFIETLKSNESINRYLIQNNFTAGDLKELYCRLQLKYDEKIIMSGAGSYAKKKIGAFALQENTDFEKSLTAWIELESHDKPQFYKKETRSLAEMNNVTGTSEELIRGSPIEDFTYEQALLFCKNATKTSCLKQKLEDKWRFSADELLQKIM